MTSALDFEHLGPRHRRTALHEPTPTLLTAIEGIHAASDDGARWHDALGAISTLTETAAASLVFFDDEGSEPLFALTSPTYGTTASRDRSPALALRRIAGLLPTLPVAKAITFDAADAGGGRALVVVFAREGRRVGALVAWQRPGAGAPSEAQGRLVESIVPFVRRSSTMSRRLWAAHAEASATPSGLVFLDETGSILAMGPRACDLLRSARALEVDDHRLRSDRSRIRDWIGSLLADRDARPYWFRDADGATMRLAQQPCSAPWPPWTALGPRPRTALLLDRWHPDHALPPTLSEIAELVADGLSDKEIAQHTGRPLCTVRTYVARLYRRTGMRSRATIAKWWWSGTGRGSPEVA